MEVCMSIERKEWYDGLIFSYGSGPHKIGSQQVSVIRDVTRRISSIIEYRDPKYSVLTCFIHHRGEGLSEYERSKLLAGFCSGNAAVAMGYLEEIACGWKKRNAAFFEMQKEERRAADAYQRSLHSGGDDPGEGWRGGDQTGWHWENRPQGMHWPRPKLG